MENEYSAPISQNNKYYIVPPVIQHALLISYLYLINTTTCKGNSWITKGQSFKNFFSNYNELCAKHDYLFTFFLSK